MTLNDLVSIKDDGWIQGTDGGISHVLYMFNVLDGYRKQNPVSSHHSLSAQEPSPFSYSESSTPTFIDIWEYG